MAETITSEQLVQLLMTQRHHEIRNWACFPELRIGTGYGKASEQRLDLWCIHMWPSSGWSRITYEVKVSRNDFRREMKKPLKRRYGMLFSNRFYFAAPKGVIPVGDVPTECGLLEVVQKTPGSYDLVTTIEAPARDTPMPSWNFLAAICRRREMDPGQVMRRIEQAQAAQRRAEIVLREWHRRDNRTEQELLHALEELVCPKDGAVDEQLLARLEQLAPPPPEPSWRTPNGVRSVLQSVDWRRRLAKQRSGVVRHA